MTEFFFLVCLQVIVGLLNKFMVADNPAKYALFKRYCREEQGKAECEGRGLMPLMPSSVSDALALCVCACACVEASPSCWMPQALPTITAHQGYPHMQI